MLNLMTTFLSLSTTVLSIAMFFSLTLASCGGKKPVEDLAAEATAIAPVTQNELNQELADSDTGRALGLQTVTYAYDSSNLDSSAKQTLAENARILKDKASVKVQIEGHCDERGGIQYNIALGERRANSAKAYLTDKGISADRLSIISYGKEKPIDQGHDENAWGKNRRANFRVTEK